MDYQTFYASVIDTREDDLAKGIHLYITVVEEEEAVKKPGNVYCLVIMSLSLLCGFDRDHSTMKKSRKFYTTVHD